MKPSGWKGLFLFTAIVILVIGFPGLTLYAIYLLHNNVWTSKLSTDQFIQLGLWFQCLIAWITLLFIAVATLQVSIAATQLNRDRLRTEYEIYKPLISHEMLTTKRFLSLEDTQEKFRDLEKALQEFPEDRSELSSLVGLLDRFRNDLNEVAATRTWPLLKDTKMSLDHIEILINHYNYIAKLIEDRFLRDGMATGLSLDNMVKNYERLLPFITLRKRISENYASHYVKYCENKLARERAKE